MQTCFFAISGVLPREEAIEAIKHTIEKTYGKRGVSVVQKNFAAVDAALSHLHQVKVPDKVSSLFDIRPAVPAAAPEFVQKFTARIIEGNGDETAGERHARRRHVPTATTQWEGATSRSKSRSGIRSFASSAASACWCAPTP